MCACILLRPILCSLCEGRNCGAKKLSHLSSVTGCGPGGIQIQIPCCFTAALSLGLRVQDLGTHPCAAFLIRHRGCCVWLSGLCLHRGAQLRGRGRMEICLVHSLWSLVPWQVIGGGGDRAHPILIKERYCVRVPCSPACHPDIKPTVAS